MLSWCANRSAQTRPTPRRLNSTKDVGNPSTRRDAGIPHLSH